MRKSRIQAIVSVCQKLDAIRPNLAIRQRQVGTSYRVRPPTSGRRNDTLDFGFVEISNTPQRQWSRYRFITPDDLDVDDVVGPHTLYGFVGYPETKNRLLSSERLQLSTTVFVLLPSAVGRYNVLRLNPAAHFVGEYDRLKQFVPERGLITGPDPHGISGGGVWRMGRPEEFGSGTNTEKLIGIGIEYRKSERVLVAVRVSLVVAFLAAAYPALAEYLPKPTRVRPNVIDIARSP